MYIYIYIKIIYIYIWLPPLKPTGFDLLIVFYIVFFLVSCLQKQAAIFLLFEDFGFLSAMSHVSCVYRYNDILCGYLQRFRLLYWVPRRTFNSHIDRLRIGLWPNVSFEFTIVFIFVYNLFAPSCDARIMDLGHFQIL